MKKKNFLFAGIAILACSVFVSSCSKDEDYAGVDYYEDWTPEQFETFASKSVSVRGEDNNKPNVIFVDSKFVDKYVTFRLDYGSQTQASSKVTFNLNLNKVLTDINSDDYIYTASISAVSTSSGVSISVDKVTYDESLKNVTVKVEYQYSYGSSYYSSVCEFFDFNVA